ncbi:hypothetical protein V8E54_005188 [Elaphomyces granulatus]
MQEKKEEQTNEGNRNTRKREDKKIRSCDHTHAGPDVKNYGKGINTQASQAVGRPADQPESQSEGSNPEETHTFDFPPLPSPRFPISYRDNGTGKRNSQRNEIEAQRGQINALIEELRRSQASSTTPHLMNLPQPQNPRQLPGKWNRGERTQKAQRPTTSQQSQRYEIDAQEGQINAPIGELHRPRAPSTTPELPTDLLLLAKRPESGIRLTDHTRKICHVCIEAKGTPEGIP